MSQHLEIEFKNMLTKYEYNQLKEAFQINENHFFIHENHYFDTADFALKEKGSALRIRQKKGSYEMTLKQPASQGLLETNQILTSNHVHEAFNAGRLPEGLVKMAVEELGVNFNMLAYFGALKTKRAELKYLSGLLVIDYSTYLNMEDYELEYEVEDYETGKEAFSGLLKEYNIPERPTLNKIRRFYEEKYRQSTNFSAE